MAMDFTFAFLILLAIGVVVLAALAGIIMMLFSGKRGDQPPQ